MNIGKIALLYELGRYEDALQQLEMNQSLTETEEGLYLYCLTLFCTKQAARACGEVERAIAANPKSSLLYEAGYYLYEATGDSPKAQECARKALHLDPEDAACLANMASVFLDQEQYKDAEKCITQALAREPDSAEYKVLSAVILFSLHGNNIEAHRALDGALEIDPTNSRAIAVKTALAMDSKEKLRHIRKNITAHPEIKAYQKQLKKERSLYFRTLISAITLSAVVMTSTFLIPAGMAGIAELIVILLAPLLLLLYSNHTNLSYGMAFSWILFFDFTRNQLFIAGWDYIVVLQATAHLLGAALLAYLLVKVFEFVRLDLDTLRQWGEQSRYNLLQAVKVKVLSFVKGSDSRTILFYLVAFLVIPGSNLAAYLYIPGLLFPLLLGSHVLLWLSYSYLLQFEDINMVVVAIGAYGLSTLGIAFLVHVLLGSNLLLFCLLVAGVYAGTTVSKNLLSLLSMVDEYETIEAQKSASVKIRSR